MLIIAHTKLIVKYSRIKMKELWEHVRFNGWILIASKWYRLYNKQVIVPNSMDQNKLSSYSMELIKMIIQQTCIQIFHTRHLKANKMSVFHIDAWAWLARNIEIIELRARANSFIMCWFWVSKFPAVHRRSGPFIYGTVFGNHHISHVIIRMQTM